MDLEELKVQLEGLTEKELFRYLRKLICESLATDDHAETETNAILDMVYSECQERGKERLYDKTFESVSKHPELCDVSSNVA